VDVAALLTWILTAGGGAVLITTWKNRRRASSSDSRLPAPLVFGHAGLAVLGLVLWIIYLANDSDTLARITFFVVLIVAILGFTMLARWLSGGGPRHLDADTRPENNFALPVVAAHGLLAAATLLLVLLAAFVA
jgi:manganese efflux pump family protein